MADKDVSKHQRLSVTYLLKIFTKFSKVDVVKATIGLVTNFISSILVTLGVRLSMKEPNRKYP